MTTVDVDQLAAALKAVAHPTRLAILDWLQDPGSFPAQERPASEVGVCLKHIQARAGVSQSTASEFMAILQRAGLVRCTKVGQWSHYERDEDGIARLERGLRGALASRAVVDAP